MITFRNVHFQYRDRPILSDLNLHLPQGSFQFLIGPSGSGKSTVLNLCSFNLVPRQGEVEIFGLPSHKANRNAIANARRHIGIVHQDARFIDHLNVYDNVLLPIIAAGMNPAEEHQNVMDLLDWVGLTRQISQFPSELSGGEQQRVALARALIMAPELILADEPTGNVDWEMGQKLMELLIQLNGFGKTVLIATHDLNMIRAAKGRVQTRILKLDRGQIEIAGAEL